MTDNIHPAEAPKTAGNIDFDPDRVDEAALALLFLTLHDDNYGPRAWKGMDWDVLDRLHQKGFIGNPKGKAKSVAFTAEGERRCRESFQKLFGTPAPGAP